MRKRADFKLNKGGTTVLRPLDEGPFCVPAKNLIH